MRLALDVENTTITREGKLHLDPFEPTNTLTMVGLGDVDTEDEPSLYAQCSARLTVAVVLWIQV